MKYNLERASLVSLIAGEQISCLIFLDCLTRLEFNGAKWIFAVPYRFWNEEYAIHLKEELSHSERIALLNEMLKCELDKEQLFTQQKTKVACIALTEHYCKNLVWKFYKQFKKETQIEDDMIAPICYFMISFVLERRVMKIYPQLAKSVEDDRVRKLFKEFILEEKEHLQYISGKLIEASCEQDLIDKYVKIEEEMAASWLEGIYEKCTDDSGIRCGFRSGEVETVDAI